MGELVDDSLQRLDENNHESIARSIHETRKNCKKGRALARLVRPALGSDYKEINHLFRDAARCLSPIRDPRAILNSFDAHVASAPGMTGVSDVRAVLIRRSEDATSAVLGPERHRLEAASELLETVGDEIPSPGIGDEFTPMKRGLEKTYKRARARLKEVRKTPRENTFHEWRKRVKYLWYEVRLLRSAAPSILNPLADSLHDLSNVLGDAHDLAALIDQVEAIEGIPNPELEAVQHIVGKQKRKLERRAISLGRRHFVETPSAFVTRMEGYWMAWR